ncbi:MAG TPA: SCO family protein [Gaiellaceae bacterium]|nr:SCO family protein [Gaiellaceae bacterium]
MRRRLLFAVAVSAGIGIGLGFGFASRTSSPQAAIVAEASSLPDASWPTGKRPAPDFALTDQTGAPVSLARFRGRPVILTFIDPLCRNLCPTEAKILDDVVAQFPAATRPAIVSVSVNQWGNARHNLLQDEVKWKLPSVWHWAIGPAPALESVWKAWNVGVYDQAKTIQGITVHNITHTEAAYVVDARGNTRALFLYPFRASAVADAIRQLAGGAG